MRFDDKYIVFATTQNGHTETEHSTTRVDKQTHACRMLMMHAAAQDVGWLVGLCVVQQQCPLRTHHRSSRDQSYCFLIIDCACDTTTPPAFLLRSRKQHYALFHNRRTAEYAHGYMFSVHSDDHCFGTTSSSVQPRQVYLNR